MKNRVYLILILLCLSALLFGWFLYMWSVHQGPFALPLEQLNIATIGDPPKQTPLGLVSILIMIVSFVALILASTKYLADRYQEEKTNTKKLA